MFRITGIELTQAIQYFGSSYPACGAPGNPQPCVDNSIPLVAGKPTAVRVYFEGATPGVPVSGFGVKLFADGLPTSITFPATADLVDVPSPPSRENAGHSVNLLVPPQWTAGTWRMSVSIFEKPRTGLGRIAVATEELRFVERALVPIRLVRMHYKGRGLDIAPPTIADFWQMMDFAQRAWPVLMPGFCIERESVEVFDGAFTTQGDSNHPAEIGTTGTIWDILERLKASEGLPSDVVYFGFYPNPAGANGGVGGGGIMIAPNVIPGLTAHELGHAQGLLHAPTPVVPLSDPHRDLAFPRYGALPWGSIGEVGFDPREMKAFPRTDFDVMGYDHPRWISPHYYLKLYAAVGAPKPGRCRGEPNPYQEFRPPTQEFFSCYYLHGLSGSGFIKKLCGPKLPFSFPRLPRPPNGPPGPIRATLFDAAGMPIFEDTFDIASLSDSPNAEGQQGAWITLPNIDGAVRMTVTHGDRVIEDSLLSRKTIPFEASARVVDGPALAVRVEWSLTAKEDEVPVFVRASSDNGRSWTAFNVRAGAKQLDIDPACLPPGKDCIVEVLVGERLRTASWVSDRLPVTTGRDALIVLSPRDTARVAFGKPVELAATTARGEGSETIAWRSDIDGDLGVGAHLFVMLSPGRHRLSVRRSGTSEETKAGVVEIARPLALRRK